MRDAAPSDVFTPEAFTSEARLMGRTAEEFLKEAFILTLGGQRLEAAFAFPDYTVERPELKENDEGNALVRIDLTGKMPPGV